MAAVGDEVVGAGLAAGFLGFGLGAGAESGEVAAALGAVPSLSLAAVAFGSLRAGLASLPAGALATFSPNPAPGASSVLSVTTAATTPAGSYSLTITGTSGALSHTASATLIVAARSCHAPVCP